MLQFAVRAFSRPTRHEPADRRPARPLPKPLVGMLESDLAQLETVTSALFAPRRVRG
jgi:hypothetical protein